MSLRKKKGSLENMGSLQFEKQTFTDPRGCRVSSRAEIAGRNDASVLQSRLREEFTPSLPLQAETATAISPGAGLSHTKSRLLKSLAGLAIVAVVGWLPLQRLFEVSSVQAVVNARVVTMRAPIAGVVQASSAMLRVGGSVAAGELLTGVVDALTNTTREDSSDEARQAVLEDLRAVDFKLERMEQLLNRTQAKVDAYRGDRSKRVAADQAAADAEYRSVGAVLERAQIEWVRQTALLQQGVGAASARETAQRDRDVAEAARDQIESKKALLAVEAEALAAGRFVGDDYNDEPRSAQRLDELEENLISLRAERATLESRSGRLAATAEREAAKSRALSSAQLTAPVGGQVWEVFTSAGEQVAAGQPLLSILDCSNLLITAAVSEATYNSLSIGMSASFVLGETGASLPARIVQLSGVATAASNLAILPSALVKESYRVEVAVDGLGDTSSCPVGQTGRVVFAQPSS